MSRFTVHIGDCLAVMPTLAANSIEAIVTDPPYGLNFMGKDWDHGVPGAHFWTEALRVAKPGAFMLAFGGTRTYHRLACAIEDAGWEIRDCIMWCYGSGFPKSHNLDGEREGWGTALKPAYEPIIVARKPLAGTVAANVLKYGTGAMNIDGCRVGTEPIAINNYRDGKDCTSLRRSHAGTPFTTRTSIGRWPANLIHDGSDEVLTAFLQAPGQQGDLTGHSKERTSRGIYGDFAAPQDAIARQDSGSAARFFYCAKASRADREDGCAEFRPTTTGEGRQVAADNAYQRDKTKRLNHHPTVKPTALMRYLCRLVTPPRGTILDPFTGSGSTGRGAVLEGFDFVGIEREADFQAVAMARIAAAASQVAAAGAEQLDLAI